MSKAIVTEWTLRSSWDKRDLGCRLYVPTNENESPSPRMAVAAVIAHPYKPLGGSQDDRIVLILVNALLEKGVTVATFDFRGDGRTSWTSQAEIHDYATVLDLVKSYASTREDSSAHLGPLKIIIGGYSYGSMIAANMPLSRSGFDHLEANNDLATLPLSNVRNQTSSSRDLSALSQSNPKPAPREFTYEFLLISPLRPPLTWFMNPLAHLPFGYSDRAKQERSNLSQHPVLIVIGSVDNFTAVHKVQKWVKDLRQSNNVIDLKIIEGASHFYQEARASENLIELVQEWVSRT